MRVTREEAFRVLELEETEDEGEIRRSFKRLALKWHPDKNQNSEESTEKFKRINAAYARLTTADQDDDDLDDCDPSQMFNEDLFNELFAAGIHPFFFVLEEIFGRGRMPHFGAGQGHGPAPFVYVGRGPPHGKGPMYESDDDEYDECYSDESDEYYPYPGADRSGMDKEYRRWYQKEMRKAGKQQRVAEAEEFFRTASRSNGRRHQDEHLIRLVSQLPRPVMVSRTETAITVSVDRKGVFEDPSAKGRLCFELDWRRQGDPHWHQAPHEDGQTVVTCSGLDSGIKYSFRCRGGVLTDSAVQWGEHSVESVYATAGRPTPAASSEQTGTAQSGLGKAVPARKATRARAKGKAGAGDAAPGDSAAPPSAPSQEEIKAREDKEAAVRKAMEQAAADYAAAEQMARQAADSAAGGTRDKKGKKKKGKKKAAAAKEEQDADTAQDKSRVGGPPPPPPPPPGAGTSWHLYTTRGAATVSRGSMSKEEWERQQQRLAEQERQELEMAIQESLRLTGQQREAERVVEEALTGTAVGIGSTSVGLERSRGNGFAHPPAGPPPPPPPPPMPAQVPPSHAPQRQTQHHQPQQSHLQQAPAPLVGQQVLHRRNSSPPPPPPPLPQKQLAQPLQPTPVHAPAVVPQPPAPIVTARRPDRNAAGQNVVVPMGTRRMPYSNPLLRPPGGASAGIGMPSGPATAPKPMPPHVGQEHWPLAQATSASSVPMPPATLPMPSALQHPPPPPPLQAGQVSTLPSQASRNGQGASAAPGPVPDPLTRGHAYNDGWGQLPPASSSANIALQLPADVPGSSPSPAPPAHHLGPPAAHFARTGDSMYPDRGFAWPGTELLYRPTPLPPPQTSTVDPSARFLVMASHRDSGFGLQNGLAGKGNVGGGPSIGQVPPPPPPQASAPLGLAPSGYVAARGQGYPHAGPYSTEPPPPPSALPRPGFPLRGNVDQTIPAAQQYGHFAAAASRTGLRPGSSQQLTQQPGSDSRWGQVVDPSFVGGSSNAAPGSASGPRGQQAHTVPPPPVFPSAVLPVTSLGGGGAVAGGTSLAPPSNIQQLWDNAQWQGAARLWQQPPPPASSGPVLFAGSAQVPRAATGVFGPHGELQSQLGYRARPSPAASLGAVAGPLASMVAGTGQSLAPGLSSLHGKNGSGMGAAGALGAPNGVPSTTGFSARGVDGQPSHAGGIGQPAAGGESASDGYGFFGFGGLFAGAPAPPEPPQVRRTYTPLMSAYKPTGPPSLGQGAAAADDGEADLLREVLPHLIAH